MSTRPLPLLIQTLAWGLRGPWRPREIVRQAVESGISSLPIICVSTAFAGMVVSNEIAWHLNKALSTVSMIPGVTGQFILRELGTAIPALLLVSKVGAATTAEVGTMKITEQVDALKLLRIDPVGYLVFPRFVASVLSTACLTLISVFVTLACALAVAVAKYGFSPLEYLNALRVFVGWPDLASALVKGTLFGAAIPVISCSYGLRCQGGAEGVGTATTNAVVASTLAVIVIDFFTSYFFSLLL